MTARMRVSHGATLPLVRGRTVLSCLVDAAAIVVAWWVLLVAENIAVGFLWREQFSASWEISFARHTAGPIALVALAPLSLAVLAVWDTIEQAAGGHRASVRALVVIGAIGAGAAAFGVSAGRHFGHAPVRVAFVVGLSIVGGVAGGRVVPRLAGLGRRPVLLGAFGFALAAGAWLADGYVLPLLYPGFHYAMLAGALLGAALVAMAFRVGCTPTLAVRVLAAGVACAVVLCAAWTPSAVRALDRAANVRMALAEHAPLLGRAVVVASWLHPPPDDGPDAASGSFAPGEVARSLDWTGHDLVLLTVDALRADHLSSYGYGRLTTPNIDAVAREGAFFESAYCPTPHTSYSVTSMLTGKYLRPLLGLGLGQDSETWPQALRRYGWRTAAFYPPAVFFIDEERFASFEQEHLGFEYAKVEFADPALRETQVSEYLDHASATVPLFLWVHFFEPHEPYVVHPEHVFHGSSADVDAYDSEVAAADDGIGRIVRQVRAHRRDPVVMITADHGEEFGEHGGRYHGTTVYEEQVHVPLVIAGPGVPSGRRLAAVVQTVDLLPTALSALGIPRPARVRGRDLGSLLAGDARAVADDGFAFAETDDYALIAEGKDRLVCERRVAACAQYRPGADPGEHRDVGPTDRVRFDALRARLRATERDHGRYEAVGGTAWPEALRRGIQGEAEVALDVASLLDDADVTIRRKAAEIVFRLHVAATIPGAKRALDHDEDEDVRRWLSLALVRMGEPAVPLVEALRRDARREWRRLAALSLAEVGDERGCDEIASWWESAVAPAARDAEGDGPPRIALDQAQADELLTATGKARCRAAVPALVRALEDVRVRAHVADALAVIGDVRARAPLLSFLATEGYVTARSHEARALLSLGARDWSAPLPAPFAQATLQAPRGAVALKLVVLLSDGAAYLDAHADGVALAPNAQGNDVRAFDLPPRDGGRARLDLRASTGGVVALWLLPASPLD